MLTPTPRGRLFRLESLIQAILFYSAARKGVNETPLALARSLCIMRFESTRTGSSFAKTLPAAHTAAQAEEAEHLRGDRGPVLRGRGRSRVTTAAGGRRRGGPRPR